MCWQCEHPGSTRADYLGYMRGTISRFGWAVQGVHGDKIHSPWAYTVGLTPYRRPELVVTGMRLAEATGLLNDVADHVLHAGPPKPGEQIPLVGGPLIEIVKVAEPWAHLVMAVELFREEGAGTATRARRRPRPLAVGRGLPGSPRWPAGTRYPRMGAGRASGCPG
jgi:Domain of unknown function (DUF4262)